MAISILHERRSPGRYAKISLGGGFLDLENRRDANLQMVKKGFAWHYSKNSKDTALAKAQTEAKAAKRGLWNEPENRSRVGHRLA